MPRKLCWSYNVRESGRPWVRAYEKEPGGILFLESLAPVIEAGEVITRRSRRTGEAVPVTKRLRVSLKHRDRGRAVTQAETLSVELGKGAALPRQQPDAALTLDRLFTLYEREVTPEKGEKQQVHDRQAMRMFRAYFGASTIVERMEDGKSRTEIGRKRFNAFVRARREGRVEGFPRTVGDRTVQADVQFMIAVFNWAAVEREDGTVLLQRNPWKGFPVPRERNPKRPPLSVEIEAKLLEHCTQWRVKLALILCRETGRRLSAVRRLRWPDVDLANGRATWKPEHDKSGKGRVTPLSPRAVEALREVRKDSIGWVFPAPEDDSKPASRDYFVTAMQRLKARAGIEVKGLGYHAGKRAKVRDPEFRRLDPKHREALLDTTFETQRRIYDDVTVEDLERAVGGDR